MRVSWGCADGDHFAERRIRRPADDEFKARREFLLDDHAGDGGALTGGGDRGEDGVVGLFDPAPILHPDPDSAYVRFVNDLR